MDGIFDNPDLFSEFKETTRSSDGLLLAKCKDDDEDGNSMEQNDAQFQVGTDSDDSSDSDDADDIAGRAVEDTARNADTQNEDGKATAVQQMKTEIRNLKQELLEYKQKCQMLSSSCSSGTPLLQLVYMTDQFSSKQRSHLELFISQFLEKANVHPQHGQIYGCTQFFNDFKMDKMYKSTKIESVDLTGEEPDIIYPQPFRTALPEPDDETEVKKKSAKKAGGGCFNCGGGHSLNECKEPKDQQRIKENLRKFREGQKSGPGNVRYTGENNKFDSFVAGQISDELRAALGLADDQLPLYIYKMRLYGYPPGHLLHARQELSGLAVFDKDGNKVSADSEEEGEVEEAEPQEVHDVKKLIVYPGFNAPLKPDMRDEARDMNMPPLSRQQSIETMTEQLTHSNMKRSQSSGDSDRKRHKTSPDTSVNGTSTPGSNEVFKTPGAATPSPTSAADDANLAQKLDFTSDEFKTPSPALLSRSSLSQTPSTPLPYMSEVGASGGASGKQGLPDAAKFRVDVEEHIPYENLPGATGTYDKMRTILADIKKVKQAE